MKAHSATASAICQTCVRQGVTFLAAASALLSAPDSAARENAAVSRARAADFLRPAGYFEANQGQFPPAAHYAARGRSCVLMISPQEAVLDLGTSPAHARGSRNDLVSPVSGLSEVHRRVVRFCFVGANVDAPVGGESALPGRINYLIGADAAAWVRSVATFERVRVHGIYDDVDLVYYSSDNQQLEYDFIVAPGASPEQIALRIQGADNLCLSSEGDLVIKLGANEIQQPRPLIYQIVSGERRIIAGGYRLSGDNRVNFEIGPYDRTLPLCIDPILSYATYFGGSGADVPWGMALGPDGSIYVAGETLSVQLPTTPGAYQTNYAGGTGTRGDAFVARFNNTGSALIYMTYLGGRTDDAAFAVAVDAAGNACVTGFTDSTNYPVYPPTAVLQTNIAGSPFSTQLNRWPADAFVTMLDVSGSNLIYSTYFGGTWLDYGFGVDLDAAGNAYIAGYTESTNLQITAGSAPTNVFGEGFVAKVNPTGEQLIYATYLGGTNQDAAYDVAVDASGEAFVTGFTGSPNFPNTNAVQTNLNNTTNASVATDAFAARLSADGSQLVYATFIGGSANDVGSRIALSGDGEAFVIGSTLSADFPKTATNLFSGLTANASVGDVFVTRFSAAGTQLVYSVVFGGSSADDGWDVAVDLHDFAHLVGSSTSTNFPAMGASGMLRATNSGGSDVFVATLDSSASTLTHAVLLGGAGDDFGYAIATDAGGNRYITGQTSSTNFPTLSPFQSSFGGNNDAFLAKISNVPFLTITQGGGSVSVAWPAFAPEFSLESRTNLGVTNGWATIISAPAASNGLHTVTLSPTNETEFFRLRKP